MVDGRGAEMTRIDIATAESATVLCFLELLLLDRAGQRKIHLKDREKKTSVR